MWFARVQTLYHVCVSNPVSNNISTERIFELTLVKVEPLNKIFLFLERVFYVFLPCRPCPAANRKTLFDLNADFNYVKHFTWAFAHYF